MAMTSNSGGEAVSDMGGADALSPILMADDIAAALWSAVECGRADDLVPFSRERAAA